MHRGLVRQLGKPALLAATYKGDAAAIAGAALEELEAVLVDSLSQLERLHPTAAASASGAGIARQRCSCRGAANILLCRVIVLECWSPLLQ